MGVKHESIHNNEVVFIKRTVLNDMITHCQEELPNEACGLLSGKFNRNNTLWKMKNIDKSPTSFAMDMKQVISVVKMMKSNKESLTGIYHSHPTAAPYPSLNDIMNAHYPDAAYFIVSFASGKPKIMCYSIVNQNVKHLNIEILE